MRNVDYPSIFKHIFHFLLFGGVNWVVHTVIVSIIAFFHFSLGHRLTIIDNWVFENAWYIVVFSKLIAAAIAFKFISVKSNRRSPFKELLGGGVLMPTREILIMTTLLLTFFFLYGGADLSTPESLIGRKFFWSYYGTTFFYIIELFIIFSINNFFPLNTQSSLFALPIYGLIFWVHNKVTFFYAEGMSFYVFVNFVMLSFLINWKRLNWTLPAFLILFFIGPTASLIGLDPVWGKEYSVFSLKNEISAPVYIAINFIPVLYLLYKKKAELRAQLL